MQLIELKRKIALNIKRTRTEAKLSQEETADRIGIDLRHYQRLEDGQICPTIPTLFKISVALGTKVQELVRW